MKERKTFSTEPGLRPPGKARSQAKASGPRSVAGFYELLGFFCLIAGLASAGIFASKGNWDGIVLGLGVVGTGLALFATAEVLRRLADIAASARISAGRAPEGE